LKEENYNDINYNEYSFGTIINNEYIEYRGREIHFHTPSEHQIVGQHFSMEIQVF
jgi:carbonic anhydrase